VEISEESEEEIEVKPVDNQVVETSVVHSELDYEQEEVEDDSEDCERSDVSEESGTKIEEDPQGEEGYEQDREVIFESEEEAPDPASPQRRVILKESKAAKRRKRFKKLRKATRESIEHDQETKSAKQRLGDRKAGNRRTRTPSTEIISEDNEVTPLRGALRTVSPETTATIDRNNRNFLKNLQKSRRKVELAREEDNASEPSDSEGEEDEEDEVDNKASKNQKN
jgi:hypothetical protein